jgi:hypothetical protein
VPGPDLPGAPRLCLLRADTIEEVPRRAPDTYKWCEDTSLGTPSDMMVLLEVLSQEFVNKIRPSQPFCVLDTVPNTGHWFSLAFGVIRQASDGIIEQGRQGVF